MDPQRQYAQLLTLWSQGSKMLRRARQLEGRRDPEWDAWWRLGRRLAERQLIVLPVPGSEPILAVSTDRYWFTLSPVALRRVGTTGHHSIAVTPIGDEEAALAWSPEGWTVRMDTALRLGEKGWNTLCQWPGCSTGLPWSVDDVDQALTLLGALNRHPGLMSRIPRQHWAVASQMLRHPLHPVPCSSPLPEALGFRYSPDRQTAWWEPQDEDSVH